MTSESTQFKKWPVLAAGILGAFCVMIILLITSVEAVAYWTPGYYEQEYTKYHVLENLPEMTMEDLLAVTDEMMAYLRGNREDLCFLQALFPQKCRLTSSKLHGEFPHYCISSSGTLSGAGEESLQAYKVY